MKMQKGFTLIELMIVVAIIAILAAIAISQYQDYVIRSQVSEGAALADGMKTAVGDFYQTNGRAASCTAPCNVSYGVALGTSITGSYVGSVFIGITGTISSQFSNTGARKANASIVGSTLLFSPTINAGSISWKCKKRLADTNPIKDKWLASSCR
jgi:type IV pilus assembly protein PilA